MSDKSGIEWTDATWNPVTGCTKVSPGCDHCYAERIVERFKGKGAFATVVRDEEKLFLPFKWRKPRRVFVNSMSDLFHEDVPDDFIAHVFSVMARTPQHIYQILTKRHGRMRSLLSRRSFRDNLAVWAEAWPLPNVWLGVSVEDQHWADIRIPALVDTPAAVRFLSCEPLLGPLSILHYLWRPGPEGNIATGWLSWVIVGGESGPGARPMHPDWARTLRNECQPAGVPFFFKQSGQFAPVADRPRLGDVWVAPDGVFCEWTEHDGHIRSGIGDFRWPGTRTALLRRFRDKHDAGRKLDGVTWDEYPAVTL